MGRLNPRSLRWYRTPAYPGKLEVLADPELLSMHLPAAWRSCAELRRAAAVFLAASMGGCSQKLPGSDPSRAGAQAWCGQPATVLKEPVREPERELDRGRTGGIVQLPSVLVYVPEDEALAIIKEELAQYGVQLTQENVVLQSVVVAKTRIEGGEAWIKGGPGTHAVKVYDPLEVDLMDPGRRIGVEYVVSNRHSGSAEFPPDTRNEREYAEYLAREVQRQGRGLHFGAFYDVRLETGPGPTPREVAARKLEAQRLLRQQVKDFADWLKGQGVI
ncbi:MAG TPA: hypothetical protein PKK06_12110 [Phycisphaerae bacterium]|nr:hypothetical protein [Phycisphaerae bacterium]HNU46355.1 hypothetical protein [Phycisphaerae bacterium]